MLKPNKCLFTTDQITHLEHVIAKVGSSSDTEELSAVADFPVPQKVNDIKLFVGLFLFSQICEGFADISEPLLCLT